MAALRCRLCERAIRGRAAREDYDAVRQVNTYLCRPCGGILAKAEQWAAQQAATQAVAVQAQSGAPRCGTCSGCQRTPMAPCEVWVQAAVKALAKELASPAFAAIVLGRAKP